MPPRLEQLGEESHLLRQKEYEAVPTHCLMCPQVLLLFNFKHVLSSNICPLRKLENTDKCPTPPPIIKIISLLTF